MDVKVIEDFIATMRGIKLKRAEKYSNPHNQKTRHPCNSEHVPERCPIEREKCFKYRGKNHFSHSKSCSMRSAKWLSTEEYSQMLTQNNAHSHNLRSADHHKDTDNVLNQGETRKNVNLRKIQNPSNKWLDVRMGETTLKLFADTGSELSIITPDQYHQRMGLMTPLDIKC